MITRLKVRNFKTFEEIDIEIGQTVVFIGPNNSGKTSALQALALWQSGVREWLARGAGSEAPVRTGVTLNRLALTHTPISEAVMRSQRRDAMEKSLSGVEDAFRTLGRDPWSDDEKVSEQALPAIFNNYYKNLGIKNEMSKADFHSLVACNDPARIDPEVTTVLDQILDVMRLASPAR